MTHDTDAERTEFERLIKSHGGPAMSLRLRKNEDGTYHWAETQGLFEIFSAGAAWQASLRASAAPVPQGWKLVPEEPTPAMYERVMREGYYHDDPKSVKAVLRAEYQDMLAAAPHPPEAAPSSVSNGSWPEPVQLPKPAGVVVTTIGNYASVNAAPFFRKGEKFYTEQQVRELMAAHGINVNQ